MTDPALDQPQLEDYDDISEDARFPHANSELYFSADRDSDLDDLRWHWHGRAYARAIRIRFDAPIYTSSGISSEQLDDVLPLAVQLYPGYQETIYGVEGVIVSKRIFAPLDSFYDRSLLWMMEAQAEGDRLIQIRVEIDWGEPLEQRMVDGLLVAQSDPGEAKGFHNQRNAESTRVFGAAEGRPDLVEFPSDSQALLVYHVLVAGQVDLPSDPCCERCGRAGGLERLPCPAGHLARLQAQPHSLARHHAPWASVVTRCASEQDGTGCQDRCIAEAGPFSHGLRAR